MSDPTTRHHERQAAQGDPQAAARLRAARRRAGLVEVRRWDGDGYGDGYGAGNGNGNGHGNGDGYGAGNGNGNGHGRGYGRGYGGGYGDGYGDGYGAGNGNGNGHGRGYGRGYGGKTERHGMQYTDYLKAGSPVVVRSYVSGVIVGRLVAGESGTVAMRDSRWLRVWRGVGNDGSVYDLVQSDVRPESRGPLLREAHVIQQADVLEISEECYERLAGD